MKLKYTNPLTNKIHTINAEITTDHPLSSYNQPVIVLDDGDAIDVQSWFLYDYQVETASEDEIPLLNKWLKNASAMTGMGRPTFYAEAMKQTSIYLPDHMLGWLKSQGDNVSETIRNIIDEAMARDGENPV